jgi:hypothetical protein
MWIYTGPAALYSKSSLCFPLSGVLQERQAAVCAGACQAHLRRYLRRVRYQEVTCMHTVAALNTTSLNVMFLDGTYLVQGRGIPVLRVACSFCPLRSLHGLIFLQVFFKSCSFCLIIFWHNPLKTDYKNFRKPRKLV